MHMKNSWDHGAELNCGKSGHCIMMDVLLKFASHQGREAMLQHKLTQNNPSQIRAIWLSTLATT
jgi:hypothetical protein